MGDEKVFQVLKILKVRSRKRNLSFEKVFREFQKKTFEKKTSRILNLNNFESFEISKKDISKILKISIISRSQKKMNFENFENFLRSQKKSQKKRSGF